MLSWLSMTATPISVGMGSDKSSMKLEKLIFQNLSLSGTEKSRNLATN